MIIRIKKSFCEVSKTSCLVPPPLAPACSLPPPVVRAPSGKGWGMPVALSALSK